MAVGPICSSGPPMCCRIDRQGNVTSWCTDLFVRRVRVQIKIDNGFFRYKYSYIQLITTLVGVRLKTTNQTSAGDASPAGDDRSPGLLDRPVASLPPPPDKGHIGQ